MESNDKWTNVPEYIAVITSLVTLGVMLWRQFIEQRKSKAEEKKTDTEAADTISDAAITLVSPLNQRIRDLLDENKKLRKHISILQKQVKELGAYPVPQPNGNGE